MKQTNVILIEKQARLNKGMRANTRGRSRCWSLNFTINTAAARRPQRGRQFEKSTNNG